MKSTILTTCATLAALAADPASAATTIDFETTPNGTLTVPGEAVDDTYAELGAIFSGAFFRSCSGGCPEPLFGVFASPPTFVEPFTVTFANPIDFFSFENVSDSSGRAAAFDAGGNMLGIVDFFGFPAQFTLEFDGMTAIEFTTLYQYGVDSFSFSQIGAAGGGNDAGGGNGAGGGNDAGGGDNIGGGSAGAIPEPSTWALFLLGFLGIGSIMRRRPARTLAVKYA